MRSWTGDEQAALFVKGYSVNGSKQTSPETNPSLNFTLCGPKSFFYAQKTLYSAKAFPLINQRRLHFLKKPGPLCNSHFPQMSNPEGCGFHSTQEMAPQKGISENQLHFHTSWNTPKRIMLKEYTLTMHSTNKVWVGFLQETSTFIVTITKKVHVYYSIIFFVFHPIKVTISVGPLRHRR